MLESTRSFNVNDMSVFVFHCISDQHTEVDIASVNVKGIECATLKNAQREHRVSGRNSAPALIIYLTK